MTDDSTPGSPGSPMPPPQGGQPGGVPQGGPPSADGLDPKVGGLLSYLLFGWIGGLIMYLTQKHPEVRFHGAQSVIVFGGITVAWIALQIIAVVLPFGGILTFFVGIVLWLGSLVLWVILCIKGYNLEHFKLPVAGDLAEQWAAK
ncbi:MAG: DUF4870 domain-containing protein [Egibacteraceae bacterium]